MPGGSFELNKSEIVKIPKLLSAARNELNINQETFAESSGVEDLNNALLKEHLAQGLK